MMATCDMRATVLHGGSPLALRERARVRVVRPLRFVPVFLLVLSLQARAHEPTSTPPPPPLPPGEYTCRVSSEYKPKPCTVVLKDGRLTLVAKEGGLFGFEGTVEKQEPFVLVRAHHTDRRPFGCYDCAERCSQAPGTCMCEELPKAASEECLAQPLHVVLRPSGKDKWTGSVVVQRYLDPPADGSAPYAREPWVIEVTLQKKR
jgi:hypothetical protein